MNKMTKLFTNNEEVILSDSPQAIQHARYLEELYTNIKELVDDPSHITYHELNRLWEDKFPFSEAFRSPANFEKTIRTMGLGKKYKNIIGSAKKVGYRKWFDLENRLTGENFLTIKDAKGRIQRIHSAMIDYQKEEGKTSPLFYRIDNFEVRSYIQIPMFEVVEVTEGVPFTDAYGQVRGHSRACIVALNKEIEEYFKYYIRLSLDREENKGRRRAKSILKSFLRTCKTYDVDYKEILDSVNLEELNEVLQIEDRGRE